MQLTIKLNAYHDYDGNLCLDARATGLGTAELGSTYDTYVRREIYDPSRNYMAEQAVLLERLSKYVNEITDYYSGLRNRPQFPEVLTPGHQPGKSCNDTQQGGHSSQS